MRRKLVSLTFRKKIDVILLIILVAVMQIPIASSVSTAQQTFFNSGLISYSQAQDPGISVFDPPNNNGSLRLTGVGGDYLVYYSDQDPSIWETSWIHDDLTYYASKGLTTSRLGFVFSDSTVAPLGKHGMSVYNKAKMDRVLTYFDQFGMKVVFVLQNNYDQANYCGSQSWFDNWLQVTRDYKDDNRVLAFNIFGEPEHDVNGYNTWASHITTKAQFNVEMMKLVKAIHTIDPKRVVILPYMGLGSLYNGFGSETYSSWIADLKAAGFESEPNTMVDVTHPYFFENQYDYSLNPTQKAKWYEDNQIKPMTSAFGSSRCWSGETFIWLGTTIGGGTATLSLQKEYLTEMINCFVRNQVGFDLWAVWGNMDRRIPTKECIAASNFGT
jgi:hypothetical protein